MLETLEHYGLSAETGDQSVRQIPMKILLVDDSPENLFSVQTVLEPLGEELMLANSGKEALRLCLHNDFAAVLLDVRMPEMDGFETAELIRSRNRSKHTPLLFLTGYRSDEQLFRGYDLGAVDFLFRPVVPEILQSKVRAFVALSRNTELLRHQTATLSKAQARFRSILEAAPDAMVITRYDGTIVLANSRTDIMFGFSREQLIGENIRTLAPHWRLEFEEIAGGNGNGNATDSMVRLYGVSRDGVDFPIEMTCSPLCADDEVLVTSAIRDITERARAEESIRQLNLELERRVRDRTAELVRANESLQQTEDNLRLALDTATRAEREVRELNAGLEQRIRERTLSLESANKELEAFSYSVSHDLRAPLRGIDGWSLALLEDYGDQLDERALEYLGRVRSEAQRMGLLIDDLLQLSRVARADIAPARVNLTAVADGIVSRLREAHPGRTIDFRLEPGLVVAGDARLLEIVLTNLMQNAVKFTAPRSDARIELGRTSADEGCAFYVRDNGVGFDMAQAWKLFGAFQRFHKAQDFPGTGIGLAIVQRVIQRHGGRIWAEAAPDQGATFYFQLRDPNQLA
jgi:PAS domain S-box-containing protein